MESVAVLCSGPDGRAAERFKRAAGYARQRAAGGHRPESFGAGGNGFDSLLIRSATRGFNLSDVI